MTAKEKLTNEVNELLKIVANLGNTDNEIPTADCNNGNPDFRDACEWSAILDRVFNEIYDFAEKKGIEVE